MPVSKAGATEEQQAEIAAQIQETDIVSAYPTPGGLKIVSNADYGKAYAERSGRLKAEIDATITKLRGWAVMMRENKSPALIDGVRDDMLSQASFLRTVVDREQ